MHNNNNNTYSSNNNTNSNSNNKYIIIKIIVLIIVIVIIIISLAQEKPDWNSSYLTLSESVCRGTWSDAVSSMRNWSACSSVMSCGPSGETPRIGFMNVEVNDGWFGGCCCCDCCCCWSGSLEGVRVNVDSWRLDGMSAGKQDSDTRQQHFSEVLKNVIEPDKHLEKTLRFIFGIKNRKWKHCSKIIIVIMIIGINWFLYYRLHYSSWHQ